MEKPYRSNVMSVDCQASGNKFKIFAQTDLPGCDAYRWLPLWIEYLEEVIYKHPLGPDDYVFPAMGANGLVQRGEHITHDTVQKWWIINFSNALLEKAYVPF